MNKEGEIRTDKKLGVRFESSENLKKYVFGDTIDELIDGLEILKDGEFVNQFVREFPDLTENQLKRLDVLVTKTNIAKEMVVYAINRKKLSNIDDFENTLFELKNIPYIVVYAKRCQVKNIDKAVDIVCKAGNANLMNKIAEIKDANLLKIKEAIFQTDNIYEIIQFCYCYQKNSGIITQDDIKELEKLVMESKSNFYAKICAVHVKGVDKEKMQDIVEESGNPEEIYEYAVEVEGSNIENLRLAMEKTKNVYDTYWIKKFESQFGPNPNKKKRFFFRK